MRDRIQVVPVCTWPVFHYPANSLKRMVGLEGFEPPTHGLGNRCSIRLSYRPILCFQELTDTPKFWVTVWVTVKRCLTSSSTASSRFSIACDAASCALSPAWE